MKCRHCNSPVGESFANLGASPPSNAYLTASSISGPEIHYPLRIGVCTSCWLVQTEDFASADQLFGEDYAYFSSTSASWLAHAESYVRMIVARLQLNASSLVMEIAANDGYLLRNFLPIGIPCLGIEPTASTAVEAERLGIPIRREFFGKQFAEGLASEGLQSDLIIGNNVYAHVPDINDFTLGLKSALKPGGTITLEFPHLLRLIEGAQFDTMYHEHFSYLSLNAVTRIFEHAGLRIFDVEELSTHGGSLRVFGCHMDDARANTANVSHVANAEVIAGILDINTYRQFQSRAEVIKDDLLQFLITAKRNGQSIAAYGAAAKGNTLLNFAGIRPDLLPYVCDAATSKQGKFLPGSRIPILPPSVLRERRPNFIIVLPWNIAPEVVEQHAYVNEWGARFIVAIPKLTQLSTGSAQNA